MINQNKVWNKKTLQYEEVKPKPAPKLKSRDSQEDIRTVEI